MSHQPRASTSRASRQGAITRGELKSLINPIKLRPVVVALNKMSDQEFGRYFKEPQPINAETIQLQINSYSELGQPEILIHVSGIVEIKAHKTILCAKSWKFADLIKSGGKIAFAYGEQHSVYGMLEYMYSGRTSIFYWNVKRLMMFAKDYEIKGLQKLCELYILRNLTIQSVGQTLRYANDYSRFFQKGIALFIIMNKREVMKSRMFRKLLQYHDPGLSSLYVAQLRLEDPRLDRSLEYFDEKYDS